MRDPRSAALSHGIVLTSLLFMLGLLAGSGGEAASGTDKPTSKTDLPRMEACWADLEKDEATASRALLKMSTRPEEAWPSSRRG